MSQNSILWGRGVKQNKNLPQIIFTFVIKTVDLTVKTIRPDIILKNTKHKKKLKYSPLLPIKYLQIIYGHTYSIFFIEKADLYVCAVNTLGSLIIELNIFQNYQTTVLMS